MLELETQEKNLDRAQDWIQNADQKVSIFLALTGAVSTFSLPYFFKVFPKDGFFGILLFIATLIFLTMSFYKSIKAIKPNISKSKKQKSMIYFGDIATLTLEQYKNKIKDFSKEDYRNDLTNQIYVCSKIANNKHSLFSDSVIYFILSLISVIFTSIFIYYGH